MPKDDWRKQKHVYQGHKKQVDHEQRHDAKVDAWIAQRLAELKKRKRKKKRDK